MNKSQFLFVINEFSDIGNTAAKVEEGALLDPRLEGVVSLPSGGSNE